MKTFFVQRAQLIAIYFVLVIAVAVAMRIYSGATEPLDAFLGDFVGELIGMAITIAVIDRLFVLQQRRENLESIIWDVLHDLDYAMWVWQGGERVFDFNELKAVTRQVDESHPLNTCTADLLMALGNKSANHLLKDKLLISSSRETYLAFLELKRLARLRDQYPMMSNVTIRDAIVEALRQLDTVLKCGKSQVVHPSDYTFNCSSDMQLWRCEGKMVSSRSTKITAISNE